VQVKPQVGELYVLAESIDRVPKDVRCSEAN
jgi:hypothetical protein